MVLPVLGDVVFRSFSQTGRTDKDVGGQDESGAWDETQEGVEVKHVLEAVPRPTRRGHFHRTHVAHLPHDLCNKL